MRTVRTRASGAPKTLIVLAVVFVAAAIGASFFVRKHGQSKAIKVAVMTWAGAGPGYVGIQKGFFGGMPVELKVLDDTTARKAAFNSPDFEVYLTNPDQHPREVAEGLPGKMFLLSDVSFGADGLVTRSDILRIQDLRGKKIAFTHGTASDFMLSKALERGGLRRSDVILIDLDDPTKALAALTSGEVDAALSWEPLMSQAVRDGKGKILFTSREVPDMILGVFIAKPSLLEDEKRLHHFVEGWLRSVEYVKQNPDECLPIMARGFGVSVADVAGMMDGLRLADRAKNEQYLGGPSIEPCKLDNFVREAAVYWVSVGLLKESGAAADRWVPDKARALYSRTVVHY